MSLNLYALSLFFVALVAVFTAVYAWRRRPSRGAIFLAVMMAGEAFSSLAYGLELMSTAASAKLWWAMATYLGIAPTVMGALLLALWYTGQPRWLTRRRIIALSLPLLLVAGAVMTNPLHHLHYAAAWIDTRGPIPMLLKERGLLYYLTWAILLLYDLATLWLAFRAYWRSSGVYRSQAAVLLCIALPLAAIVLYMLGYRLLGFLNPAYYAYAVSGILFAWGLFRYQLVRLAPVARAMLFENLRDGVVVLDMGGVIIDLNCAARQLLGLRGQPIGQSLQTAIIPPELVASCLGVPGASREVLIAGATPRWVDVTADVLADAAGQPIGRQVVLTDVTARTQAQAALQSLNADLERRVAERTAELSRSQDELSLALVDQTRKLAALFDMVHFGGQSLSLPDLIDRSVAKVNAILGGCGICLHEWDRAAGALKRLADCGLDEPARRDAGLWPGDWLSGDGVPRAVFDLDADPAAPEFIRLPGCQAYLGAPILLRGARVGTLSIWWADPHPIPIEDIALFSTMANQIGIILDNARLRRTIEEEAAARERRRLARDLHDSVTQTLHGLVLFADTLRVRIQNGQSSYYLPLLGQLTETACQALKETRLMLYEMRPVGPDSPRLIEALQLRLEAVEERAGLDACLDVRGAPLWPVEWEADLCAVAVEALNNSLKHAHASRVDVIVQALPGGVELVVEDDGRGFDAQRPRRGGFGLNDMAERARHLGGSLAIDSAAGRGTRVMLRVDGEPSQTRR